MTTAVAPAPASAAPLAASTRPAEWFELDTDPGESTVEVDLTSLRWRGDRRELRIRITKASGSESGPGPQYLTVLATLQVNCDSGQSYWRSTSFHAQAKAEGTTTLAGDIHLQGPPGSQVQDLISEKTWVTLRRSACIQPRSKMR